MDGARPSRMKSPAANTASRFAIARLAIIAQAAEAGSAANDALLFPGPPLPGSRGERSLSTNALRALLIRMGAKVTAHGFRSSFRDWAGELSTFPREVAEAALAHSIGDETEKAYRRGDALAKRRLLMDAWAQYVGCAVGGTYVETLRRANA